MRENFRSTLLRFAIYAIVCMSGIALLFAVFGQARFQKTTNYNAIFANVSGLRENNFVRIAGVEVGKVKKVVVQPDSTVRVEFTADDSVVLTEGSRALVRYDDLFGGRYIALQEGAGSVKKLGPGSTIPISQTEPALDLDALIGGLRPVFRSLNPDQINALSGQLIQALQGQGPTVESVLGQAAAVTNTLADRDQLIGQLITNLNTTLASVGDQSGQLAKTIDSLSALMVTLRTHGDEVASAFKGIDRLFAVGAEVLKRARVPLKKVVDQTDRVAGTIMADKDFVDNLINTLPDDYRIIGREGLYGDFFTFYLCDLILKVNGKNGQPTYITLASQRSGRCTPK
ncbi:MULTISPECIES: MCE family protein [Mycobacterium]|uniref:Mce family protein Mce3B n=1 Tax=Mycobacterium kiyosense TaxID=2871094 RepID=A0A9P3Q2L3_9MYCO|nr:MULTISPECIES: MCE family protein [Mycobacterium]BDE15854.1 Mce family protein Mce3B [Mycobacterium sp. 20KCMC460]GLB80752.1 Mce family protein Mce3B [Mycobacterium kiyosense]GLB87510.1 Mce family protein Mce3B [Mycobacterium kiyosense]GLB93232.1 Mce family protein Mce3B [Mycobacterium kiyosense]GLB99441.1 Mce family protein Mce3B [Mycobacterium kiyosense]